MVFPLDTSAIFQRMPGHLLPPSPLTSISPDTGSHLLVLFFPAEPPRPTTAKERAGGGGGKGSGMSKARPESDEAGVGVRIPPSLWSPSTCGTLRSPTLPPLPAPGLPSSRGLRAVAGRKGAEPSRGCGRWVSPARFSRGRARGPQSTRFGPRSPGKEARLAPQP